MAGIVGFDACYSGRDFNDVRLIAERRRDPGAEDSGDFLSILMSTVDEETGEQMSDLQIHDEIMTFIFAVLIVLFNLIADLLYGILDPRIRYD